MLLNLIFPHQDLASLSIPSFSTTEILTIVIEDVQDSGPQFINEPYDTSIDEGTPTVSFFVFFIFLKIVFGNFLFALVRYCQF